METLELKSEEAKAVIKAFSFLLDEELTNVTSIEVRRFPNYAKGGSYDLYVDGHLHAFGDIKLA